MKNPNELYQFAKQHNLHYNTKENKGLEAFTRLVEYFPRTDYSFSFMGFHDYQSFRTHEGLTAYGISSTTLFVASRKKCQKYNLYRCQNVTLQNKLNGKKMILTFPDKSVVIDLGFSNGQEAAAAVEQARTKSRSN